MRTCKINLNGIQPIVRLSIDNALICSGDFGISANGDPPFAEEWAMKTGSGGSATHQIVADPANLENKTLAWATSTCAFVPDRTSGTLTLTISQNDQECPIDPPLNIALASVPRCDTGHDTANSDGQLQFIAA